ncbi:MULTISPECIES: DUF2092 domain-containing protein [Desulfosediminicola]|uniref:DUF2092 domain-containing protein n=1 Tax=Desulfosediminicola TaxID=2886823 RepID=UPI00142EA397|nr:DUF2092 domain-containing protein [Desulfosediminicola ganghwensis]
MIRQILLGILAPLLALGVANSSQNSAQSPAIQPEALEILHQMSDYLNSLQQFTFHSDNTIDTVLQSGQQIQMSARAEVTIKRPNQFRVYRQGDDFDQEFYFDGQAMTLYGKTINYYASMKLSKTVDINTALELAQEEVGLSIPGSDLVYHDAHLELLEDVQSGMVVGSSVVDGVEVHHLAFRGSEVDWQLWVEKGEKPLPRKYLITSKWVAGAPQYTAVLSDWNTSAEVDDSHFSFSPPPEAEEIGFIQLRRRPGANTGGAQ